MPHISYLQRDIQRNLGQLEPDAIQVLGFLDNLLELGAKVDRNLVGICWILNQNERLQADSGICLDALAPLAIELAGSGAIGNEWWTKYHAVPSFFPTNSSYSRIDFAVVMYFFVTDLPSSLVSISGTT